MAVSYKEKCADSHQSCNHLSVRRNFHVSPKFISKGVGETEGCGLILLVIYYRDDAIPRAMTPEASKSLSNSGKT